MELDIASWIDRLLTDDVVQILNVVSITIGAGLIIWGVLSLKKDEADEKVWNIIAILIGAIIVGRNLFDLFGGS